MPLREDHLRRFDAGVEMAREALQDLQAHYDSLLAQSSAALCTANERLDSVRRELALTRARLNELAQEYDEKALSTVRHDQERIRELTATVDGAQRRIDQLVREAQERINGSGSPGTPPIVAQETRTIPQAQPIEPAPDDEIPF